MSYTSYQAYIEDTKSLVKSIVIKSLLIARAVNSELEQQGYSVNYEDPYTWKYYLNLAGRRHESDAVITITSLDTMEQIPFTYDVLSQHSATLSEYIKRGEYYKQLVTAYPESEAYINGVLNPVNIHTAITSEEHTILTYNNNLLESQETQLMTELQSRLIKFFEVYTVEGYAFTDELYIPTLMVNAYACLMEDILAIRLAACHTPNAHSFHIWAYLSGFFNLGDFKSVLTINQALYLYRNIRTISKTTYSTETFNELIDVFLTERSIPLYAYNLNHNVSNIEEDKKVAVEHEKVLLNFSTGLDKVDQRESVRRIILDSVGSASGNADTVDIDVRDVKEAVGEGQSSRYLTKILEADITDTSLTEGIALIELIYAEWLRLATDGKYRLRTTVPNPSGGGTVTLSAKEAFVLLIYLSYRSFNLDIDEIPELIDYSCVRDIIPTTDALVQGELAVDLLTDEIKEMRQWPRADTIISSIVFRRYVEGLKVHLLKCSQLAYNQSNFHAAISLDSIFSKFFYRREYKLSHHTRFEDWLADRGLDLYGVSPEAADSLSSSILEKFTGGSDYDGSKLYRSHVAILNLVERLSHHDLQFIRNQTDRPALSAMAKSIRIDEPRFYIEGEILTTSIYANYMSSGVKSNHTLESYGYDGITEAKFSNKIAINLKTTPSINMNVNFLNKEMFNVGSSYNEVTVTEL